MNTGAIQKARDILEGFLRDRTLDAETYYMLGVLAGGEGKWTDAVNQFKMATKLNPRHSKAHASLALSLAELERFDEALSSIVEAQELDSEEPMVKRATETLIAKGVTRDG